MADSSSKPKPGSVSSVGDESSTADRFAAAIFEAHQIACEKSEDTYIDPETGLPVLTAFYLNRRGYCCTSYCRHCPYGIHELSKNKKD